MRPSDVPEVRSLRLFGNMSDANFAAMMQAAYLQTFPDQLNLIAEGDLADFLYVVIEGCVELYAETNGRSATIDMVPPVGTFILAAVPKDTVYLMSARTCEKSKILLIPANNVRMAIKNDSAFSRVIIEELADCYCGSVKEHKNLKLRSAVERLANQLLGYNDKQGATGRLELPHDKRRLASMLGMTPENLSRAFNTLKPYGVIVDGGTVNLKDVPALTNLAKPNPLIDDRAT